MSSTWPKWKHNMNECGFRCKSPWPIWRWLSKKNHHQTALCPYRSCYLCAASFINCKLWRPQAMDALWEEISHSKQDCFPKQKKQSLLLDNDENRNSSLGNIILKSDFPTNHTQLVSNAMFLSDYGIPADFFISFNFAISSIFPTRKQTKTPHNLIWVEGN